MQTYIALLRGINVSGHNLIKMTELRALCEEMGLAGVQTYIQSGNILFRSAEESEPLRQRLEQAILIRFGFTVPVALRTLRDLERIVAGCPYSPQAGEALYVSLLVEEPSPEGIKRLLAYPVQVDEFRLLGRAAYILCRQPVHKSKLTNQLFEQKLRVSCTQRNWATMNKLLELGAKMEQ